MSILQALLSLLILGQFALASAAPRSDYLTRDYGRFAVTYCPEDSSLVDPLVQDLSQRLPQITARLRLPALDSAKFVITPTAAEWSRVTAGSPLWANGVAFPNNGVAVLKSPRFNMNGGPLSETAVHEIVHLLLESDAPRARIPRWLNEGVSQFMAGQQEFLDGHILGRAAASGRLMRFWDIEGLMGMGVNDAHQGYAQSLAATEYFWQRYGDAGLSNLIHELRSGRDIESIFPRLFGLPASQFENEQLDDLRKRYGGSIWSDSELWISILFITLVLAAGVFAYLRRRKTLDAWRKEHIPVESEPREVPYTVSYTIVRSRNNDNEPNDSPTDSGAKHDRPYPGD